MIFDNTEAIDPAIEPEDLEPEDDVEVEDDEELAA
tara:strand:- start:7361 stop:7465 length:105 start_codon:yes stop_codon:yes gene_type:complete